MTDKNIKKNSQYNQIIDLNLTKNLSNLNQKLTENSLYTTMTVDDNGILENYGYEELGDFYEESDISKSDRKEQKKQKNQIESKVIDIDFFIGKKEEENNVKNDKNSNKSTNKNKGTCIKNTNNCTDNIINYADFEPEIEEITVNSDEVTASKLSSEYSANKEKSMTVKENINIINDSKINIKSTKTNNRKYIPRENKGIILIKNSPIININNNNNCPNNEDLLNEINAIFQQREKMRVENNELGGGKNRREGMKKCYKEKVREIKSFISQYNDALISNCYQELIKNPLLSFKDFVRILKDLYYMDYNLDILSFASGGSKYREIWDNLLNFNKINSNTIIESYVLLIFLLSLEGLINERFYIEIINKQYPYISIFSYKDLLENSQFIYGQWSDLQEQRRMCLDKIRIQSEMMEKNTETLNQINLEHKKVRLKSMNKLRGSYLNYDSKKKSKGKKLLLKLESNPPTKSGCKIKGENKINTINTVNTLTNDINTSESKGGIKRSNFSIKNTKKIKENQSKTNKRSDSKTPKGHKITEPNLSKNTDSNTLIKKPYNLSSLKNELNNESTVINYVTNCTGDTYFKNSSSSNKSRTKLCNNLKRFSEGGKNNKIINVKFDDKKYESDIKIDDTLTVKKNDKNVGVNNNITAKYLNMLSDENTDNTHNTSSNYISDYNNKYNSTCTNVSVFHTKNLRNKSNDYSTLNKEKRHRLKNIFHYNPLRNEHNKTTSKSCKKYRFTKRSVDFNNTISYQGNNITINSNNMNSTKQFCLEDDGVIGDEKIGAKKHWKIDGENVDNVENVTVFNIKIKGKNYELKVEKEGNVREQVEAFGKVNKMKEETVEKIIQKIGEY